MKESLDEPSGLTLTEGDGATYLFSFAFLSLEMGGESDKNKNGFKEFRKREINWAIFLKVSHDGYERRTHFSSQERAHLYSVVDHSLCCASTLSFGADKYEEKSEVGLQSLLLGSGLRGINFSEDVSQFRGE